MWCFEAEAFSRAVVETVHSQFDVASVIDSKAIFFGKNCLKPITDLMMPNSGSTVCFLSAYSIRPSLVLSLYAIFCIGVASAPQGSGSVKRSRQPGW